MRILLTCVFLLYLINRAIYIHTLVVIYLYIADKIYDYRIVTLNLLIAALAYLIEDAIMDKVTKDPRVIKYLDEHRGNHDDS